MLVRGGVISTTEARLTVNNCMVSWTEMLVSGGVNSTNEARLTVNNSCFEHGSVRINSKGHFATFETKFDSSYIRGIAGTIVVTESLLSKSTMHLTDCTTSIERSKVFGNGVHVGGQSELNVVASEIVGCGSGIECTGWGRLAVSNSVLEGNSRGIYCVPSYSSDHRQSLSVRLRESKLISNKEFGCYLGRVLLAR